MAKVVKKTDEQKEKAREKRVLLCQFTAKAREIREQLTRSTSSPTQIEFFSTRPLNYFIVNYIYQNEAHTLVFKTFNEWKKEGATIKKGAKAYIIWGQPLKKQKGEEAKKEDEPSETDEFFPICYLFSNEQVHFNETKEQRAQEAPKEPQKPTIAITTVDVDSCL